MCAALLFVCLPGSLAAQRPVSSTPEPAFLPSPERPLEAPMTARGLLPAVAAPGWVPLGANLLVPGAGHLLEGRRRSWIYLGVEALVWAGYLHEHGAGVDDRRGYRDLAWQVARAGDGIRVDGDFEYYERMARWPRSGAFDRDPGTPGVQPEEDPATFNGDAWRLAVAIFLGGEAADPESQGYDEALEYYRDRAYGEAFQWDWSGQEESLDRFKGLIERSDDHLRNASLILGGAVLNRVVSTLDLLLTRRTGREIAVRLRPTSGPGSRLRPTLTFHVAFQ